MMAAAAATVKKVALELGGKNPNVVFADADLPTAVDFALTAVFLHSGQVCSAGARLVVQDSVHDEVVDEIVRRARKIRLGGRSMWTAETGPLISAAHRAKVASYVDAGVAEARCCAAAAAHRTIPRWRTGSTTCQRCSTSATRRCRWCTRSRSARC